MFTTEWGFEPELREDIERFAQERGYRIERLVFDEPEQLSPAVAELYRRWYRERGIPDRRLVIESFVLLEPYWALRTGSTPFWMTFNMQPLLDWAQRYLADAAPFDFIHLMLFAHGVNFVGLPSIDAWRTLLHYGRREGSFLGLDPDAYPAHFTTFARYAQDMHKLPERYPMPAPLPFERFAELQQRGSVVLSSQSACRARTRVARMNRRRLLAMTGMALSGAMLSACKSSKDTEMRAEADKMLELGSLQHEWTRVRGLRMHSLVSIDQAPADAPTVVLVHGSGLSGRYMIPTAVQLTSDHRVYVPDMPGFGDSDKPEEILDVLALADWIAAWMPAIGLKRASFLGNSFGCQVIADLAARHRRYSSFGGGRTHAITRIRSDR